MPVLNSPLSCQVILALSLLSLESSVVWLRMLLPLRLEIGVKDNI